MVHDPTTILQVMTEYFGGVLVLVLTFLCWHFDRHGRANATTKASYVALVSLILLILTPPVCSQITSGLMARRSTDTITSNIAVGAGADCGMLGRSV